MLKTMIWGIGQLLVMFQGLMAGMEGHKKVKKNNVYSKKGKELRDQFVVQTIFVAIENTKNKVIN